ncbi:MAG: DUF499 domain-containing protein [Clostridiales bacterium]|jgi:hypothetical protein|nr:DUF499 domain-containing protein [Clostridiales bacterium]
MQAIKELCKPRDSVFADTARDDVLNLSDLIEGKIDPDRFFDENFKTKGMELLFETAFKRFAGKSETGVIKLTQAMGGGKTHNMLALALLAQNPDWRRKFVGKDYDSTGIVQVVAFSGRESDAEFGIWGSIAEQLGKKEFFADHYAPLKAPGETAWVNLLKDQRVLILLDELPPYLVNAKSIDIGKSDLCTVTITALSNLFTAIGKGQLANVCLVFSDLKATYEVGSQLLSTSFNELENEANRAALNLEPVALNTDEVYDILRKRLFTECPDATSSSVNEIAIAYKEALVGAGKSELTGYTGDAVFLGIKDSYPFHPSIKELYARFKENPGFQQTRGLIKLMRQVVRGFYESGQAANKNLVNVFDIDLNDRGMLSLIKQIKPSLEAAISHDIAQGGKAVAEVIDEQNGEKKEKYAQNVAKLLLMSSLNETLGGVLGLLESDILGFLCEPGVDLNSFKKALDEIVTQCWYLKADNRGRFYFQNTKNMVAEMNTLVDSYSNENAKKELRKFLNGNFEPKLKKCYESLYALPAIDEIHVEQNKVSLVIFEPYAGGGMGLHPDLQKFFGNCPYPNRVLLLSGQRNVMEKLYQNAKRLAAIRQIIVNMKQEHLPETDQQYVEAESQRDKAATALLQTIREAFITLYYPSKSGLSREDFKLEFKENKFNGEEQIIAALKEAMKFEDFSAEDAFIDALRKKCEARIFTQAEMPWTQILERAATEKAWQWYHPKQMDELRKKCISADIWRDVGGYLKKGPFEKDPTDVTIEQTDYNEQTGEFTLRVRPVRGDKVYYDIGAEPTKASKEVQQQMVVMDSPAAYFVCIDSEGGGNPHPTGKVKKWMGNVPLKREQRQNADGHNVLELKTHKDFEIRYTTDGSNPKESGRSYSGDMVLPADCRFVLTAMYYKGELVSEVTITVDDKPKGREQFVIDDAKALEYELKSKKKCGDTEMAYAEFAKLKKLEETYILNFTVTISDKKNPGVYIEINTDKMPWDMDNLQATVDAIRESAFVRRDVEVEFEYKTILFPTGAAFKQWVEQNKLDWSDMQNKGVIKQ